MLGPRDIITISKILESKQITSAEELLKECLDKNINTTKEELEVFELNPTTNPITKVKETKKLKPKLKTCLGNIFSLYCESIADMKRITNNLDVAKELITKHTNLIKEIEL